MISLSESKVFLFFFFKNNGQKLTTTRERANQLNKNLSIWLGGPWSLSANVVAVDYFMSTNLIDIAIYTNRHKSYERNGNQLIHFDMH